MDEYHKGSLPGMSYTGNQYPSMDIGDKEVARFINRLTLK